MDYAPYLEGMQNKYSGQLSPDENLSMRVLKREQQRIEKLLYPNPFVRLIRRGFKASQKLISNIQKQRLQSASERHLQNKITAMGMGEIGSGLRQHIAEGKDRFSIPVSRYQSQTERMDYDLSFAKQPNGTYKMDNFKVSFNDEQNGQNRQNDFSIGDKELTASQAANLIAGRAVQTGEKWIQLDLNDKDPQGKFRVKEFHPGYGYDLLKADEQLPLRELKNELSKQQLLDGLANGEKQNVNVRINGQNKQLSIEANPQFKTINVFDDQNQKITIGSALGKEIQQHQKQTQTIRLGKKNRVSVG
jgi:hypothetical protein